jgi:hypothetical protein
MGYVGAKTIRFAKVKICQNYVLRTTKKAMFTCHHYKEAELSLRIINKSLKCQLNIGYLHGKCVTNVWIDH